jgi:pantetheine-phosphate adenylyltransferase
VRKAIMAASFDPITNGHVDLANRASILFDEVIVAVYSTPKKNVLFSSEERLEMVANAVEHLPNVTASLYDGLLVNFAQSVGADVLVRGLRAISDFDYEFQLATMNRRMLPHLEVMFFLADIRYMFLSSSIVKEIAELGGDVADLVPDAVAVALTQRFRGRMRATGA